MSDHEKEHEEPDASQAAEQGQEEEQGPDTSELNEDPAYNPEDENLKDLKGG